MNKINTVLWKNNCSIEPHSIISSTTNIVRITFQNHNNFVDESDSFRIEWIVNGCGGVLNKLQGEFASPEYPGFYNSRTTCEWNIITNYGHTIEITIQDIWFETSKSCSFDYIAVCIYVFFFIV